MAVRRILEYPHTALRQKAKKVRKIDKSTLALADDLVDTLYEAGGVGLAANQIGVLRRVIAIQLPEEEEPRVYVNPEITYREGERDIEEGCLSIPGYHAIVTRAILVKAKGLDRQAKQVRLRAEGLFAQVLEHEIDHLNGILYLDHLESHQDLIPNEPPVSETAEVGA